MKTVAFVERVPDRTEECVHLIGGKVIEASSGFPWTCDDGETRMTGMLSHGMRIDPLSLREEQDLQTKLPTT